MICGIMGIQHARQRFLTKAGRLFEIGREQRPGPAREGRAASADLFRAARATIRMARGPVDEAVYREAIGEDRAAAAAAEKALGFLCKALELRAAARVERSREGFRRRAAASLRMAA